MLRCFFFRRILERALACGLDPGDSLGVEKARALRVHVGRCARCRKRKEEIDALFDLVRSDPFRSKPEGPIAWNALRDETVARALAEGGPVGPWRWALLAAAAAAAIAYAVIRTGSIEPPALAPAEAAFIDRMEISQASRDAAGYLSDSRELLLGVLYPVACDGVEEGQSPWDVSIERERSRELLLRSRVLAPSLGRLRFLQAQSLSQDLDLVLVEVARLPDCASTERVSEISKWVRERELLVRLDLFEAEL